MIHRRSAHRRRRPVAVPFTTTWEDHQLALARTYLHGGVLHYTAPGEGLPEPTFVLLVQELQAAMIAVWLQEYGGSELVHLRYPLVP